MEEYGSIKFTETEIMRLSMMSTLSDTMRSRASAVNYINQFISNLIKDTSKYHVTQNFNTVSTYFANTIHKSLPPC